MIEQILAKGVKHKPERRSCNDCVYMQAAISWWCVNEDACKAHGTSLPARKDCKFWEPCRTVKHLPLIDKIFGNFFIVKTND